MENKLRTRPATQSSYYPKDVANSVEAFEHIRKELDKIYNVDRNRPSRVRWATDKN